jgi:23S rRNA (cytidine1920-2'-O)/16S rRNA (cytidine1409-2'-O)-methyltransferase
MGQGKVRLGEPPAGSITSISSIPSIVSISSRKNQLRLDALLVSRGLFPSREQAQRAIRAGEVRVGGEVATKPGKSYPETAAVAVETGPRYASRGGEKLKGALESFRLVVAGAVALDVGASTGGFTDCLLQEGAKRVYSLDVGRGQLAWKLRCDPRVAVIEERNARYLRPGDLPERIDLVTADVSFISLTKVLPALQGVLAPGGKMVVLVKPQFEAGREEVGRGGVVRSAAARAKAVDGVRRAAESLGLRVEGEAESVLQGPAGNREFFLLLLKPLQKRVDGSG